MFKATLEEVENQSQSFHRNVALPGKKRNLCSAFEGEEEARDLNPV